MTIMSATEKMMYGSLAYLGAWWRSLWFWRGLSHSQSVKHSDGSIYALLGQVIGGGVSSGESTQASNSFVGYVNSVAISVNLTGIRSILSDYVEQCTHQGRG